MADVAFRSDWKTERQSQPKRAALLLVLTSLTAFTAALVLASTPSWATDRVGAERCGECHEREYQHWNQTFHSVLLTESDDDTVLELAEEIPDALGIENLEADPACAGCHFSPYRDEKGEDRLASIDCESCHGKASGWVDVHSDYGSLDGRQIERAEDENPIHRKRRLEESFAQGMHHPSAIVRITQNCFGCHVGPGERIVNQGGHAPGSDLELVTCFDESVRHNFHRSSQRENAPLSIARRRQLYVVGRALDLEYSLRGLARATEEGRYLRSMKARVEMSRSELEKVQYAIPLPQLAKMLSAADEVALRPNNAANAIGAADLIHSETLDFAVKHDGEKLVELDPLVPAGDASR